MTANENDSDSEVSPRTEVENAAEKAVAEIETAQTKDDPIERVKVEQDAVQDFIDTVAALEADGHRVTAGPYIQTVSDVATNFTKTDLKDAFSDSVNEQKAEKSDRPALDAWLEDHVIRVVELRSTDHRQDTLWRWELDHGTTIESGATKDGIEHLRWDYLRDSIYQATGEWTGKPSEGIRSGDEWKEYIVEFVEDNRVQKKTRGTRTATVERMNDWIRQTKAFYQIEDAIDYGGMRIDEDEGELHIPNQYIQRWCDSAEITTRAFQSELDGRGLLSDRVNGASDRTTIHVDGQYQSVTYWVIDLDVLSVEPFEVVEEPQTPAEKEAERQAEQNDGEDGSGATTGDESHGMIDAIEPETAGGDDE